MQRRLAAFDSAFQIRKAAKGKRKFEGLGFWANSKASFTYYNFYNYHTNFVVIAI